MTIVDLPIVVTGCEVVRSAAEPIEIEYETGITVRIPRLDRDQQEQIFQQDRTLLSPVHFDDITVFLEEVGARWSDPSNSLRQEAVELSSQVTGLSSHILDEDYQRIGHSMQRQKLYDLVEADLGNTLVLDDWIPTKSIYTKAVPKGRVLHLMVGNVPLAGLFTLVRSVLAKNVTIAKLPSRDLISCLYFARAFLEVDSDHPVAQALSVVYWPGGSELETAMIEHSDVVCAWGQGASLQSAKQRTPFGIDFIEFGPKESIQLIRVGAEDLDDVCLRAAYDISVYEQEACFSPQRIFLEGDHERFARHLALWLEKILGRLPTGFVSTDKAAHLTRARKESVFGGLEVHASVGPEWTVIVASRDEAPPSDHPLGRCIYIHPVARLDDALEYVHREVQTVAVSPWDEGRRLADALAARGACRVCDVGLMSRPRPGFTHDAMRPLHQLVRWIGLERGLDYKGRFRASGRQEFSAALFLNDMQDGHS